MNVMHRYRVCVWSVAAFCIGWIIHFGVGHAADPGSRRPQSPPLPTLGRVVPGDLDADGQITWNDYRMLGMLVADPGRFAREFPVRESEVSGLAIRADVNRDLSVNARDLDEIKRLLRFPVDVPATAGASPAASQMPIGINLSGVSYWSSEWIFVDAFKQFGLLHPPNVAEPYEPNSNGWPRLGPDQIATGLLFRDIGDHYPSGYYICRYEGKGRIEYGGCAKSGRASPGRLEVRVDPGNSGISVKISGASADDPIRNVRLWMPGFENARCTFHPLFLERLRGFKVLRFMDWQCTNYSTLREWSQRTTPEAETQTGPGGVAVEHMIELCNELDASPWFCMPHMASDSFVLEFAKLVKARLKPELKVYLEYSNEVWAAGQGPGPGAYAAGKGRGLSDDPGIALNRFYSDRSVEIFRIWEKEFEGKSRLVRVMGAQAGWPERSLERMNWRDAHKHVDALAVADYLDAGDLTKPPDVNSVDDLLNRARDQLAVAREMVRKHKAIADKYHVSLITYEGGPGFVTSRSDPRDEVVTKLCIAAHRDPRIYDLYAQLLADWKNAGGGLFMGFNSCGVTSKWGSWGHLEHQDQPILTAPKYRALRDALEGRAASPR